MPPIPRLAQQVSGAGAGLSPLPRLRQTIVDWRELHRLGYLSGKEKHRRFLLCGAA